MAGEKPQLNDRQRRFVEEYLVDLNAMQAAIRAGYSAKTAKQIGQRLLTHVDVAAAIEAGVQRRSIRTGVKADRALEEAARLAFYDPRKLVEATPDGYRIKHLAELDDDTAAAIASVKVNADGSFEYKAWDKNAALEKLFKHLSLFKDSEDRAGGAGSIASLLAAIQGAGLGVRRTPPEGRGS